MKVKHIFQKQSFQNSILQLTLIKVITFVYKVQHLKEQQQICKTTRLFCLLYWSLLSNPVHSAFAQVFQQRVLLNGFHVIEHVGEAPEREGEMRSELWLVDRRISHHERFAQHQHWYLVWVNSLKIMLEIKKMLTLLLNLNEIGRFGIILCCNLLHTHTQ